MAEVLMPGTAAELSEMIAHAAAAGTKLEIRGGGSKADVGAPGRAAGILSMARFTGVVDYDPAELVLDVRAATPLADIETMVAAQNQMLAFEPLDHGPIFGRAAGTVTGAATIGGVIAAAVAGSSRLTAGAARDHFLGFEAVSGRAEIFSGGAKVVKNVTGYDLPKILAGSWGRLAAMTRVTLKVLPRPQMQTTLVVTGLDPMQAHKAMALAMGSQSETTAAAHLPAAVNRGTAITALRLQGFGPSVAARREIILSLLGGVGVVDQLNDAEADALWQSIRKVSVLEAALPLWRINVPPSGGPAVVARLEPLGMRWFFDWAAGLIWANFTGDASLLRAAASAAGGHAMLLRGAPELRATTPAFHPESAAIAALSARVRRGFDPHGVFATNRFLDEPDAD